MLCFFFFCGWLCVCVVASLLLPLLLLACLTKVRVSGGKAWGRQRYLDTEAYRTYKQMGK